MRRIVVRGPFNVEVEEAPRPVIKDDRDVLIRTYLTAISRGSEMHIYRGEHPNLVSKKWGYWTEYPIYPGYSATGVVEECGAGVERFRPGDYVIAMAPHAEYLLLREDDFIEHIPDTISPQKACFTPFVAISIHALQRSGLVYGSNVCVVGLGTVGLITARLARLAGARRVVALDVNPGRLAAARELGVDLTIRVRSPHDEESLSKLAEVGAEAVFEASGTPEGLKEALRVAREGAKIVLVGFHPKPIEIFLGDDFFHKELELVASRSLGPLWELPDEYPCWTAKRTFELAVEQVRRELLALDVLVKYSQTVSYKDIRTIYDSLANKADVPIQTFLKWT